MPTPFVHYATVYDVFWVSEQRLDISSKCCCRWAQSFFFLLLSVCRKPLFNCIQTIEHSKKSLCPLPKPLMSFSITCISYFAFSSQPAMCLLLGLSTLSQVGRNLQPHYGHTLWPAHWYLTELLPSRKLPLLSHARSAQKMSSGCKSIPSKGVFQGESRALTGPQQQVNSEFFLFSFLKYTFSGNDQEADWKEF